MQKNESTASRRSFSEECVNACLTLFCSIVTAEIHVLFHNLNVLNQASRPILWDFAEADYAMLQFM